MTTNLIYAFGKLSEAVEILTLHQGDIRRRVFVAGECMLPVTPEMVPEQYRSEIKCIHHYLTRFPALHSEGTLWATYKRTRTVTALRLAKKMHSLYWSLKGEVEINT